MDAVTTSNLLDEYRQFESLNLNGRLELIRDTASVKFAMTSAFNYSGVVLLYHIKDVMPEIPIYFIDTRFHFPETINYAAELEGLWKLNIVRIATRKSENTIEESLGVRAWESDPDACCYIRKVEPLMDVLPLADAWISALRRDQSKEREQLQFVEEDARGTLKIYPMADWSSEKVWQFIKKHDIPYHPLHDMGYPSIGCTHCTKPVRAGEHERAGRWSSFPKMECGIHKHKTGDQ